jgi:hypothetical protein
MKLLPAIYKNMFYTNVLLYLIRNFCKHTQWVLAKLYILLQYLPILIILHMYYVVYIYFTFICTCMNKKYFVYAPYEYQYLYHLSSYNLPKILSTIITVRVRTCNFVLFHLDNILYCIYDVHHLSWAQFQQHAIQKNKMYCVRRFVSSLYILQTVNMYSI